MSSTKLMCFIKKSSLLFNTHGDILQIEFIKYLISLKGALYNFDNRNENCCINWFALEKRQGILLL